ncbi:leukocyte antigen CD37 [Puntigrus tetrazona]|uniref:leukocyte antigen CD37 n=1 Tax=Puntigrus tetrazona TaxID=1606681 RepID=UPI001C8A6C17|nr:leukocyte antigen CD37 [Puntigrus tetrazona]
MASECCLSLTKYFLFLFNLTFCLLGSLILSVGLWTLLSENIMSFMPSYTSISLFSYLLIISGSVTTLLGFFGCLGSLKAVKCLLATYFILLTVLLAAQIVGGVLFYTQNTQFIDSLKEYTIELMKSSGGNDTSYKSFETTIDEIQQKAKCCGWNGIQDWGESIPCSCFNVTVNATQHNCFKCFSNGTYSNVTSESNLTCPIYQGCGGSIENWLDKNLSLICKVILTISVVEICGMILSMCLYKEGSVDYNTILH